MSDLAWMKLALEEARRAQELGEVPVGSIVVREGRIIGRAHNLREGSKDPLAHAEVLAIREASGKMASWRLEGCTLYATLEPCAMCAGALVNSRVQRLVFGARDPKAGFCGSLGNLVRNERLNHQLEVREGVLAEESAQLLREFFRGLRGA